MCGIAGIYNLNGNKVDKNTLVNFTDSMYHRGPDGAGYELLNNDTIGFGHRRLSILDLSDLGKQPMCYANARYWITYNGEIFNFSDIKNDLIKKKYSFKSETDTEVILAAYAEWGKDCLIKFNGMFAFSIWDNVNKTMFLARDRFGIKPLYYLNTPNKIFAFASETRAFKYLEEFTRTFNQNLLAINYNDTYALEGIGLTPFNNILQLLPGHYAIINNNNKFEQKRWWNILDHSNVSVASNFEDQVQEFYDLFRDSCKLRLISDVPIATALSGGLDSSVVYSTVFDVLNNEKLARVNSNSQKAFTAIFPDIPNDETEYATKAARFFGKETNFIKTDFSNLPQSIEKETELVDFINNSPITSISGIYSSMKKNGITVSMDGHGVDEMMYGYRKMIYALYNNALQNSSVKETEEMANVLINMYHPSNRDSIKNKTKNDILNKQRLLNRLKKMLTGKHYSNEYSFNTDIASEIGENYNFKNFPIEKRILYTDFFQSTLPSLLRNFDRAGMINSVEIRMPFMDWRLVSYVFSLQLSSKVGNGYTKLILREAMKGKMHEEIRTRTFKVGISSPLHYWFNTSLNEWVKDKVNSQQFLNTAFNGTILRNEFNANKGEISNDLAQRVWKNINIGLIN